MFPILLPNANYLKTVWLALDNIIIMLSYVLGLCPFGELIIIVGEAHIGTCCENGFLQSPNKNCKCLFI